MPDSAKRCIESWRRYMPDYEIREWNEQNFDVHMMRYTSEAYDAKKYAYVSDVARFWALLQYGGVYFDTDVEVVRPMDDILAAGPYMGVEVPAHDGQLPMVAPGLGMAAEAGMPFLKDILDAYSYVPFVDPTTGQLYYGGTVVQHNTIQLAKQGLKPINDIQRVAGFTIYPMDYFNPLVDATGELEKTPHTHTIHWYSKSWCDKPFLYYRMTRILHRIQRLFR